MRIWSPFAFTPTGQPVAAVSPPKLRVLGGTATAQQFLYAQQAFYKFCATARLSTVPNPREQGYLPDGSRYEIVVIGPQSIMTVLLSEDEDLRASGIAFTLRDITGILPPEYAEPDGVTPIIYLLTPRVVRNTRRSNGEWVVRKPKFVAGGKAVNADKSGLKYYAGIGGDIDSSTPNFRSDRYGINGQAYLYEDYPVEAPLFHNFIKAGQSVSNTTPLPFFHEGADGKKYVMQLNVGLTVTLPTKQYIELLVGEFKDEKDGPVGPVVSREEVSSSVYIDYRSITFSKDGRTARASGMQGGMYSFFDIAITTAGTNITVVKTVPTSHLTGTHDNYSFRNVSSGAPGEPGYTVEGWQISGSGDGGADYGSVTPVDEGASYLSPGRFYGHGEMTFVEYSPSGYSYDRRGEPLANSLERSSIHVSSHEDKYTKQVVVRPIGHPDGSYLIYDRIENFNRTDTSFVPSGPRILLSSSNYFSLHAEGGTGGEVVTVEGSGHEMIELAGNGEGVVFYDQELKFSVVQDTRQTRRQEWIWVSDPEASDSYRRENTMDEITTSRKLIVRCAGATILSQSLAIDSEYLHVAFVAADPMTGALVVNVQEVHMITKVPTKSWIFVVDDTGAKLLHEVMPNVPQGTHIRVSKNASLISV